MTAASVLRAALVLSACAWAQVASAACYFVYAPNNELIYRSNVAPVDLSLPCIRRCRNSPPEPACFSRSTSTTVPPRST
jgi:hypothetical protein